MKEKYINNELTEKIIDKFLSQYPTARTMYVGTTRISIEDFLKINPIELF